MDDIASSTILRPELLSLTPPTASNLHRGSAEVLHVPGPGQLGAIQLQSQESVCGGDGVGDAFPHMIEGGAGEDFRTKHMVALFQALTISPQVGTQSPRIVAASWRSTCASANVGALLMMVMSHQHR